MALTLPKYHLYKIYRNGTYLGLLQNVTQPFAYSQDINTAGSSINIPVGITADTSATKPPVLTAEDGTWLTAEDGTVLTDQRAPEVVGDGDSKILMRNGNKIQVWEYSQYWPNGQIMFSGKIERWEATFGAGSSSDIVNLIAYPDGTDLANYVIPGQNSLYQISTWATIDASAGLALSEPTSGRTYTTRAMQAITIPAGVTNVAAITFRIGSNVSGDPQTFTVKMWNSPFEFFTTSPLATSVVTPVSTAEADCLFTFGTPATVTPGVTYYFSLQCSSNLFATGSAGTGGGYVDGSSSGSGQYDQGAAGHTQFTPSSAGGSLYYILYASHLTTQHTYTNADPSTGMVLDMMTSYNGYGGLVTAGTVQATSLSVTYTFALATILEGIQQSLKMSPSDFYWYVDMGLNKLNYKRVSTTADYKLTKGVHLNTLKLGASIENVKNSSYFTGGQIAPSTNLFKQYSDTTSISNYGVRLDRQTNNRVVLDATAKAIEDSFLASNKNQKYQTTVTVLDNTTDITQYKVGQTIGFNGFGSFIDTIIIQIVRVDYSSDKVQLTLGALPPRQADAIQQAINDIASIQTIDNPTSPS